MIPKLLILNLLATTAIVSTAGLTGDAVKWPVFIVLSAITGMFYLFHRGMHKRSNAHIAMKVVILNAVVVSIFQWNSGFSPQVLIFFGACVAIFYSASVLDIYQIHKVLVAVAIAAGITAAMALAQRYTSWHTDIVQWDLSGGRIMAFLGHKNDLGSFCLAVIPILTARVILSLSKRCYVAGAIQAMVLAGIVVSGHVSGCRAYNIMAPAIAIITLLIIVRCTKNVRGRMLAVAILCFGVVLIPPAIEKLQKIAPDWSNTIRTECWSGAKTMVAEQPLGYGPGGYARFHPKFKSEWLRISTDYQFYPAPMSVIGRYFVDFGVIGGIAFIIFTALVVAGAMYSKDHIASACGIGVFALFLHGLIDITLDHPPIALLFFLFCGIVVARTGEPRTSRLILTKEPISTLGAVFAVIGLALSMFLSVAFYQEEVAVSREKPFPNPISVLGKYAAFANDVHRGRNHPRQVQWMITHAQHYRHTDYLLAVYFAEHKQLQAARVFFKQFESMYKLDSRMNDFKLYLEGQ